MPIQIERAGLADRDDVVALLVAQLLEHAIDTPPAAVENAVDGMLGNDERGRILVARDDGVAVATAYLAFTWTAEHGGRACWLEELYVTPTHRERGLGRTLLLAALQSARAAGAAAVDLEVTADHARAANLYAREGFVRHNRTRWVHRFQA